MTATTSRELLRELAALYGIEPSYRDPFGVDRPAPDETLLVLARSLGAELPGLSGVPRAIAARRRELAGRLTEPVVVAWDGRLDLPIRATRSLRRIEVDLALEDGDHRQHRIELAAGPSGKENPADGWLTASGLRPPRLARLPDPLPLGYHQLEVRAGQRAATVLVVSAPTQAYGGGLFGRAATGAREWGSFLPLYALRTERSEQGPAGGRIADLADLDRLVAWTAGLGGSSTGTLPLFASFLDPAEGTYDPSPYSPASRLFWNELYADLTGEVDGEPVPELGSSPAAQELLAGFEAGPPHGARERLSAVDYRRAMARKRRLLDVLAGELFDHGPEARRAELEAFRAARPEADAYAAFRAVGELRGEAWGSWGEPLAAGDPAALRPGTYDPAARRRHLYAQWLTDRQLHAVARRARAAGRGLYLDLPLGVHHASYDLWRYREAFAVGASVGAPPDAMFAGGQGWGFPPPHPEAQRAAGYGYLRRVLANLMPVAGMLRLDHVMALHRLYWIPPGGQPTEGAYVRYPAEEQYAIFSLESHRAGTVLVGENLGVVPDAVERGLGAHGVGRMYVAQFAVTGEPLAALAPAPADTLAALDTHDTATFPAFLEGRDIDRRVERGLLDPDEAPNEAADRQGARAALVRFLTRRGLLSADGEVPAPADPGEVTRATLIHLAAGPAATVLVNLEDLWGETAPQNEPGTPSVEAIDPDDPARADGEGGNWRRRSRLTLEEMRENRAVTETLRRVDAARRAAGDGDVDGDGETEGVSPDAGGREADAATAAGAATGRRASAPSPLSEDDLFLLNEGRHFRLYDKLGCRPLTADGVDGLYFAVWAPTASAVSVVGDFNGWRGGAHTLAQRWPSGVWEGFIPGLGLGTVYKYEIVSYDGAFRENKADPFAFRAEEPPRTASVAWDLEGYAWGDGEWMAARGERQRPAAPMAIYEVHLGSWRRDPERPERLLGYREVAPLLADHVVEMGFTHVELLPLMEHPYYGSWGYQTTGYFAPTARYGDPHDLMFLVDHLHQRGIGVILDWVPSHFPGDAHGLAFFDGTYLFEHADPRQGYHPDWHSLIFNYGREAVRSFLISSALFWLERYHADGLRVDAVASMLYRDYSREEGEWIPNRYGGRENLEALEFLRQLNAEVYARFPDVQTWAEESTAWPGVSRPTYLGGLGFGFKWDMGWMHDTLAYFAEDPLHRKFHHNQLTFRGIYAFSENFCLPLSHDEVVHGKGSLLAKMRGSGWDQFANLRLLLAAQAAQPGKKLLFMGAEIGQWQEWSHERGLDWHLLEHLPHEGVRRLVADLNRIYRAEPALHEGDCDSEGFEWIEANDADRSVIAFLRKGITSDDLVLVVMNFTPVARADYRLGVPRGGRWQEILNSDAAAYWGSGSGNLGGADAAEVPAHGRDHSLTLTLPPLAALFLKSTG